MITDFTKNWPVDCLISDFQRDLVEQFTGINDARLSIECSRKMPLVARNDVDGLGGLRALQELRVGRIGRNGRGYVRLKERTARTGLSPELAIAPTVRSLHHRRK